MEPAARGQEDEEDEDNGERVQLAHLKVFMAAILGFSIDAFYEHLTTVLRSPCVGREDLAAALAELDTAGNEIWSTVWSVADEDRAGFKGVLAADGSSVVRGIAETVASAGANVDVSITKFDSTGEFVWESVLGGVLADGTTDVFDAGSQPVVDANGSVFVLINSEGGAIGSTTNQGGGDVFIVKLDGETGEMIHP